MSNDLLNDVNVLKMNKWSDFNHSFGVDSLHFSAFELTTLDYLKI